MKKNIITNKITPCCGLPFSVIYWWVSNLTLNTPADRQYLLTQISQNGVLSIDGWKVLINSGTLEADASLTKAEFLKWFDCGKQPTCGQLKLIIEGFKIGNWKPETELPPNIGLIDAVINGQNFKGNVYTKEQVNKILTTSFGGDLVISDNPQPTSAKWYFAKESGTYPNTGGLVVDLNGKLVVLNYDGTTWSKVEVALPSAKLPLYSAIKSANISAGTQFIDDENGNIIYRVKTGQTLNVGEKPETVIGSKVDRDAIDFYNVTVNKPLTEGNYYTSATAKNAVPNGYKQQGTIITYLIASKTVERIDFLGTATADSDVVIVLDGVTYNVPILAGDTNKVIGGKMRAFVFDGWTTSGFDGRVVFTKNVGGQTQITRVTYPSGVDGTLTTNTYGEDEKWVSEQFGGKSSAEWTDATKWKALNQVNTYNFQKTV